MTKNIDFVEPYDVENFIQTPNPTGGSETNYQYENIRRIINTRAQIIWILNEGPGLLYVIVSHNSEINFTCEHLIREGQLKSFNEVDTIGLRSPTANLSYRVSELDLTSVTGQGFSVEKFKRQRDNQGIIVFQDDMEFSTLKFNPIIVGIGTIARSTDTAYTGDFSLKSTSGGAVGDHNEIQYIHTDFHKQKLGAQILFASKSPVYNVYLVMYYFNGTQRIGGTLRVTSGGDIFYQDKNLVDIFLGTTNVFSDIKVWNSMKIVIDISTSKYVSVNVNGQQFDLNGADLQITPTIGTIYLFNTIIIGYGTPITAYFDNYIFTEDET